MKEKLQEYALIAEIISAVCIVLSLIFVGMQVRQSAEETAVNSQAIQASVREAMMQTEFTLLLYSGEHNLMEGEVTPEQRDKWLALQVAFFRARENAWVQHENGILDDATYYSYRDALIKNLEDKDLRNFWREVTEKYDVVPGFVADINAEINVLYDD